MKKTKNSHLNILCIIKYLNKKQTLRVEKVHLVKNHSKVKENIIKAIWDYQIKKMSKILSNQTNTFNNNF